MCTVSAVSDYYRTHVWPLAPQQPPKSPFETTDEITITREQWDEYQRLKHAAMEIDKKTNQPDCVKPDVEEWERKIEHVLRKKGLIE